MNMFSFTFSRILRRWLIPRARESAGEFFDYKINKGYIEHLMMRYAALSALAVVHVFFFIGGVVLALAALARSVDVDGVLHTTALFWTGLGLTIYAVIVAALAARALRSTEIKKEELVIREEARPSFMPRLLMTVVKPALEGVVIGLQSPRVVPSRPARPPPRLRSVDSEPEGNRLAS